MKVCDAADWFVPDFSAIISSELREVPRFHRKQWEFAAIFDRLQKAGVLREDACGVSFGAGRELLLYSLSNHVGRIWATDIYSGGTIWPDARTEDLDDFVRGSPPFDARLDRLFAKSMDMRQIEFDDETFDFAYSSSAVEHIGGWEAFKTHLAEVKRVLKPGGIYVMTTDISYGPALHEPGNFKFDAAGLQWWLQESGMAYDPMIDCRIARHLINTPLPSDLITYLTPDGGVDRPNLFGLLVQAQMLVGRHPHSSVVLEMRKAPTDRPLVAFPGLEETTDFLKQAQKGWEAYVEGSNICPHPAAYIPSNLRDRQWATTFMWLGNHPRTVRVEIQTNGPGQITIGVNKAHTDTYWVPIVSVTEWIEATPGHIEIEFSLPCEAEWNYAIHGRALGDVVLTNVKVSIRQAGAMAPAIVRRIVATDGTASHNPAPAPNIRAEPQSACPEPEPVGAKTAPSSTESGSARQEPASFWGTIVIGLLRPTGLQIVRAHSLERLLR